MNERIKKAYASAPKTWVWQLLAAFIVACLLAWSGTAVRVSSSTGNGLEVAGNILSGIFHPSAKRLLTLGTARDSRIRLSRSSMLSMNIFDTMPIEQSDIVRRPANGPGPVTRMNISP